MDQELVRRCLGLASSFLITDTAMNPESGLTSWSVGFNRLVDLVVALHARNELELVTINMASRACSECWTAGGSWRGLGQCRAEIRQVGGKLKRLLDPNGRTYKGALVLFRYQPSY